MYLFFLSSTSQPHNLLIFFQFVDRGSCKGDSGAPLFGYVQEKDHKLRVAYGVVHGCIGECCSIEYPSVFTSLGDSEVLTFVKDFGITTITGIRPLPAYDYVIVPIVVVVVLSVLLVLSVIMMIYVKKSRSR